MKKLILFIFILLTTNELIHAQQAWTSPKGKFYSQIGLTLLTYDGYVGAKEEILPLNRDIVHHTLQGYLQYGITDKWMVTAIVPFTIAKSTKTSDVQPVGLSDGSLNALSNIQTGLTYRFYEKNGFVFSGKINTSLPTAKNDQATGLRSGDDAFGIGPSLLMGLGRTKFFTSAEIGYIYRNNNYSSQTIANFQIGKFMGKNKKLLSIFHSELRFGNKDGNYDDGNSKYTALYLNDLRYIAFGAKFGYNITPHLMTWADVRFWASGVEKIGAKVDALFPGLTFSVSYSN